ncbi:MAG: gliding motility-associated C-terminal domain-containing protein [Bacteroidales bacterium]
MRIRLLIAAILLSPVAMGQITAPGMNSVRYTNYPSAPAIKDPVFFYCNSQGTASASLNAVSPGGTGPFTFSWFRWSDATRGFTVPVSSETGVMNSTVTGLGEGGYRVNISNSPGYSTSLTAWIFYDSPPGASARLANNTCDYVALDGDTSSVIRRFYYRDPLNGNIQGLKNELTFTWSSDPESVIPYPSIELNPITFTPPLDDVTYKLTVNSLGCASEATFFYESIHVKADFTVSPANGEAPLEVAFTDKSVRAATYFWEFGDDSVSAQKDPGPHTYYIPGEYSVKLTVESQLHCVDSLRIDDIVVEPSALAIPNVFTPNEDGLNDKFMIDKRSLRYVSVVVFSRNGTRVYDFHGEGPVLKEWDGWDGNVGNTSAKASPGVYYYIIKALGWDDVKYDSKEYRGFVYLYR